MRGEQFPTECCHHVLPPARQNSLRARLTTANGRIGLREFSWRHSSSGSSRNDSASPPPMDITNPPVISDQEFPLGLAGNVLDEQSLLEAQLDRKSTRLNSSH